MGKIYPTSKLKAQRNWITQVKFYFSVPFTLYFPHPKMKSYLQKMEGRKDTDVYTGLLDSEGEGEGGMIWENGNSNMYTVM